jgi:lambda repressor-like predicted transcriptional regulator
MLTDKQNIINRKITLMRKGFSQRALAALVGCSPAAITFVINNKTKSRQMHERIVAVLGVSLAGFWPEIYGPEVVAAAVGTAENSCDSPPQNFEKILPETRA